MVIARVESLILDQGVKDALERAEAYLAAGADGIMIHSRATAPDEVFEFAKNYASFGSESPLVAVPTSYHTVTEQELADRVFNVVIYANHMLRAAYPQMSLVARTILEHGRATEAEPLLSPIKEALAIIPENRE